MKRVLIIANTYYQMILSIQMRLTVFNGDEVVLLLSDQSNNAYEIVQKLRTEQVFHQTAYVKLKGLIRGRKKLDKLKDFADIAFGSSNRYSLYLEAVEDPCFDELICYNYNIDIIGLYSLLCKYNRQVKVSLFEEGVLSYGIRFESNFRRELIGFFRKLQGKKDISEAFYRFYCYYPQLYYGPLETMRVPPISMECECTEVLRCVFNIDREKLSYPQKYIYFSSVCDFAGGAPIGELELVKRIAEMIGRDKLIIKAHPRDARGVYEREGLTVDRNSSIPWEAIQLSGDFSDKVFLTATSGSVLSASFMTDTPPKTFFMYKLCNIEGNEFATQSASDIDSLLHTECVKGILSKVRIIDSLEEIIG